MTDPPKDAPPAADDELTEEPRGAGRLIARFFLLPLVVVLAAVGIFLVFNYMTFERRGPRDYLQEVRGGAANRRWQAAFELSRSLGNLPPEERAQLCAETLRVFETLSPRRPDDLLVRRYLVLVLGRLGEPAAIPALLQAAKADDPDTRLYAIWALGKIGGSGGFETVLESSQSEDPGARKMAAYVLGALGDKRAIPRLQVLAEDRVADVRWNAAIALGSLGDPSGLPVLRSMLDRAALARQADLSGEQVEAAMVNAMKALVLLRDTESLSALERLAGADPNLRVRDAARKAMDALRGKASKRLESRDSGLVG
ncbi:MAG TPA: HEAT repeat domain-containing protein [Thermoanaerobaculia bacterium]|nr:HEAT repeat domain-containing protein [Thermoanaerobaculia bacterium]